MSSPELTTWHSSDPSLVRSYCRNLLGRSPQPGEIVELTTSANEVVHARIIQNEPVKHWGSTIAQALRRLGVDGGEMEQEVSK